MAARWSPKPLVGVRVPGGMPSNAGVAQLVEHFLAKEDVRSSSLLTRSKEKNETTSSNINVR